MEAARYPETGRAEGRKWKGRLFLLSWERQRLGASPASKQSSHMDCHSLLQRGEKRGGGEVVPRKGADKRGEKSSIFRPAHTADFSAVCNTSSHSH